MRKIRSGISIPLRIGIVILVAAIIASLLFLADFESSIPSNRVNQDLFELPYPPPLLASPDLSSINYSITFAQPINGSYALTTEPPQGLSAEFIPSEVSATGLLATTLRIMCHSATASGDYTIKLEAQSRKSNYSATIEIKVLRYLVVTVGTNFLPQNLTVTGGSTVTWLRLNGVLSQTDDGSHDIDFSSGVSLVSPTLAQYNSWSYHFTQSGIYDYYCKYHPFMTGEIFVTS